MNRETGERVKHVTCLMCSVDVLGTGVPLCRPGSPHLVGGRLIVVDTETTGNPTLNPPGLPDPRVS